MHRLLMTSGVYRQAATNEAALAVDQDNRLLTHASVRRLDAEILRDRMLFVSGALSGRMYGPPVAVKEDDVGQVVVAAGEPRRSIYVQARRSQPVALLTAFDAPVMETNCERRSASTVATQSLMLMNGDFVIEQAAELARRAQREAADMVWPAYSSETTQLAGQVDALRRTPAWQFGYGRFDEASQRVARFQPLPYWTGGAWQGGAQLPDPQIGWVILHPAGGHPGHGADFAAVRRWTAPRRGNRHDQGDAQPSLKPRRRRAGTDRVESLGEGRRMDRLPATGRDRDR